MSEISMPRLSDTMEEGTIARWLKKAGDEIKKGDILAEIETDKATMDLESYDAGVLEQILVQEGETAPIGQAVAIIGSGKDGGSGQAEQKHEQPAPPPTRTADQQKEDAPQAAETNVEDTQVAPAAGGPQSGRASSQGEQQERMESPEIAPPRWRPVFLDYLHLGFTNATAFSPTDVMPLTLRAKYAMLVQSTVALALFGLVVARAVNAFT